MPFFIADYLDRICNAGNCHHAISLVTVQPRNDEETGNEEDRGNPIFESRGQTPLDMLLQIAILRLSIKKQFYWIADDTLCPSLASHATSVRQPATSG